MRTAEHGSNGRVIAGTPCIDSIHTALSPGSLCSVFWCEPASLRESEQESVTASHQKVTMQGPSSPPIVMTRATRMMAGLVTPIGDQSPTLNDNLRTMNVPCREKVPIHRGVADAPFRQAIASRCNLLPVTKLHLVIVRSVTRIK